MNKELIKNIQSVINQLKQEIVEKEEKLNYLTEKYQELCKENE